MPTQDERIVRILGQATEPLYTSEITKRLNHELGGKAAYTMAEISTRLQGLGAQVAQLTDGRWKLERRAARR
jgi:predicted Zn-ribbon and HTH transcriptional regulator